MNKNNYWFIGILFAFLLEATSCSESEGVDEYANWQERNDKYLEDIVAKARANTVGNWKIIERWTKPGEVEGGDNSSSKVTDFIYVEVLNEGSGNYSPLYSDSIDIHYRMKNIEGTVLYQSFYDMEDPDPDFAVAVRYKAGNALYNVIPNSAGTGYLSLSMVGITTAVRHMKEGDRWRIHIPWQLGYGDTTISYVLGYSVLICDLTLETIIPL